MSSGAALASASDLKVAGVMGIFEAAIGVPALKAVSRLIRELLRTRTGPGDRDFAPSFYTREPITVAIVQSRRGISA
jgi:hypothetical protein